MRPSFSGSVCVVMKCRHSHFGQMMPFRIDVLESLLICHDSAVAQQSSHARVFWQPGYLHQAMPLPASRRPPRSQRRSRTSDCHSVRVFASIRQRFAPVPRFELGTRPIGVLPKDDGIPASPQKVTDTPDLPLQRPDEHG
jgi:hypothetical protein